MSTDREITRIVRSWLDEGVTVLPDRVLDAVLDQVPATPQRHPSWLARLSWGSSARSRPQLLPFGRVGLLLVVLLLLLAGLSAALLGSLLRNDDEDRQPSSFLGPVGRPCTASLPDDVILRLTSFPIDAQNPEPVEITAYADGLVIDGPSAELGGSFNHVGTTWSQRRLAAAGSAAIADSLTAGLETCRSYPNDGYVSIQIRTEGGIRIIGLGPDPFETRVATAQESAAVQALLGRLDDRSLGIPAADWADAGWRRYQPERWRFSLTFSPPGDRGYPSADSITMPDGSSLRGFAEERGTPDVLGAQCVVATAPEASEIASLLTAASGEGEDEPQRWAFSDDEGVIQIAAAGLLPHEPDCQLEDTASESPQPSAAPSTAPGVAPLADACDYLAPAAVADIIAGLDGDVEHHLAWTADWNMCWYPVSQTALVAFSARRAVPADNAVEQARRLFGGDAVLAEELAGHQVFFNGCTATDGSCHSAIAIAADPHYVVITWSGGRDTLRAIAERVFESLD